MKKFDDIFSRLQWIQYTNVTDGRTEMVKQYRALHSTHCLLTRDDKHANSKTVWRFLDSYAEQFAVLVSFFSFLFWFRAVD